MMRMWAYGLFLHTPILLVGQAWLHRSTSRVVSGACLGFAFAIIAVAVDAFVIEPYDVVVRRITISSPKLPGSYRLAVLADIQTDQPGAYERRVLEKTRALQPDMILLPGGLCSVRHSAAVRGGPKAAQPDFPRRRSRCAARGPGGPGQRRHGYGLDGRLRRSRCRDARRHGDHHARAAIGGPFCRSKTRFEPISRYRTDPAFTSPSATGQTLRSGRFAPTSWWRAIRTAVRFKCPGSDLW